jgi:hypothetical protein
LLTRKKIILKALVSIAASMLIVIFLNSAFDLYNDFAFDKAIVKESPFGYIPLLKDVYNYGSSTKNIRGGDYVYVEDWLSAHNGRVAFAKVRSKFDWGYINRDLLVEANINVLPIFSSLALFCFLGFVFRTLIRKINV